MKLFILFEISFAVLDVPLKTLYPQSVINAEFALDAEAVPVN